MSALVRLPVRLACAACLCMLLCPAPASAWFGGDDIDCVQYRARLQELKAAYRTLIRKVDGKDAKKDYKALQGEARALQGDILRHFQQGAILYERVGNLVATYNAHGKKKTKGFADWNDLRSKVQAVFGAKKTHKHLYANPAEKDPGKTLEVLKARYAKGRGKVRLAMQRLAPLHHQFEQVETRLSAARFTITGKSDIKMFRQQGGMLLMQGLEAQRMLLSGFDKVSSAVQFTGIPADGSRSAFVRAMQNKGAGPDKKPTDSPAGELGETIRRSLLQKARQRSLQQGQGAGTYEKSP